MIKKYSIKFWILFWLGSAIFLTGWYLFWNTKNKGISSTMENVMSFLPFNEQQKKDYQALVTIGDALLKKDGQQKTFMVLFQNNMEIRPGGGFIGAFGILKLKDGKVVSMETHDLSNFDGRIPATVEPPYPMRETLRISSWKLRDSNFSPDFSVNAQKAVDFYYMGKGEEKFDGVIGMTTNVLSSILKVTGPVTIEGYPGTYDSENAILSLEYQVEKAFEDQGIDRGQRKSVMGDLARVIEKKVFELSASEKIELAKILQEDLNKKDIQLQFTDPALQQVAANAHWTGNVDKSWNNDYLMTSDANLGAYKSDYYVKRNVDYTVDFSKDQPTAHLQISYNHTATKRDWMTNNYLTYLRVYVPEGSWLTDNKNFDDAKFGSEFDKKYFAAIVRVPIGTSKTVEINYTLPPNITEQDYKLLIQKQAGLNDIPISVHLKKKDGTERDFQYSMNKDIVVQ